MRNSNFHKRLAAVAAAVMLLAGCGSSGSSSSEKESKTDQSSAAGTAAVVTLPTKEDSSAPAEDSSETAESTSDSGETADDLDTSELPYTPAAWKVTSPSGNTMYMMGSMHALKPECKPLPDYVMEYFNNADVLAVECDISDSTKSAAAVLSVMHKITYQNGETVEEHLGEELWSEVSSYIEAYGGDPDSYMNYQVWYVYSLLENLSLEALGLDASIGFDMQLLENANEQGKEIYEVESALYQMDMLSGFDEEQLKAAIKGYSAENKELIEEELMKMYTAWKTGDVDSVSTEEGFSDELYTEEEKADIEEFNRILVTERNVGMADKAMELIDSGKNVLYVVGLAHYLGDGGIIDLLTQKGCTVERVAVG